MQSLVVAVSLLQTGGSPRVQQDLVHLVVEQLWTAPLIVFVVLVGAPHDSAPHCFCSAAAGTLNVAMANTNPATMVTCCVLSIVISTSVTSSRTGL